MITKKMKGDANRKTNKEQQQQEIVIVAGVLISSSQIPTKLNHIPSSQKLASIFLSLPVSDYTDMAHPWFVQARGNQRDQKEDTEPSMLWQKSW